MFKGLITIETLNEYLLKNKIIVKEKYFKSSKCINDEDIINQLRLISEVDRILTSYALIGYTRLYSVIGKRIESFKVQLRKLSVDLAYKEKKKDINETDMFLINTGEDILKKGWETKLIIYL